MMCKGLREFVGHVGCEVAALLIGARQLFGHPVERYRQPLEVTRTVDRDAHAQVAVHDRVGGWT